MHRSALGDRAPRRFPFETVHSESVTPSPLLLPHCWALSCPFCLRKNPSGTPPAVSPPPASKLAARRPLDLLLPSCWFGALGGIRYPVSRLPGTWDRPFPPQSSPGLCSKATFFSSPFPGPFSKAAMLSLASAFGAFCLLALGCLSRHASGESHSGSGAQVDRHPAPSRILS